MTVLIVYATEHGSTKRIAERIAERLDAAGVPAHVAACDDVDGGVSGCDAVVVGSAIHGGAWLPVAVRFVRTQADALARRPVWLFSVSCVGDETSLFPTRVGARLRAMRKETTEIRDLRRLVAAREHHNFTGAVEPDHWDAKGRAFFRMMRGRYGDNRDWPAVDAWVDGIARSLMDEGRAATVIAR